MKCADHDDFLQWKMAGYRMRSSTAGVLYQGITLRMSRVFPLTAK